MSTATLRAAPAQDSLRVGDRFPALKGQFLTGRDAVLPQAASGKVALVAIGFTYKSRFPVEAWADWYRTTIDPRTDVTFFEVPMIGGLATLGRWFIDRGMRKRHARRTSRPRHHGLWRHGRLEAAALLFSRRMKTMPIWSSSTGREWCGGSITAVRPVARPRTEGLLASLADRRPVRLA